MTESVKSRTKWLSMSHRTFKCSTLTFYFLLTPTVTLFTIRLLAATIVLLDSHAPFWLVTVAAPLCFPFSFLLFDLLPFLLMLKTRRLYVTAHSRSGSAAYNYGYFPFSYRSPTYKSLWLPTWIRIDFLPVNPRSNTLSLSLLLAILVNILLSFYHVCGLPIRQTLQRVWPHITRKLIRMVISMFSVVLVTIMVMLCSGSHRVEWDVDGKATYGSHISPLISGGVPI